MHQIIKTTCHLSDFTAREIFCGLENCLIVLKRNCSEIDMPYSVMLRHTVQLMPIYLYYNILNDFGQKVFDVANLCFKCSVALTL